jgi:hypothetical protein
MCHCIYLRYPCKHARNLIWDTCPQALFFAGTGREDVRYICPHTTKSIELRLNVNGACHTCNPKRPAEYPNFPFGNDTCDEFFQGQWYRANEKFMTFGGVAKVGRNDLFTMCETNPQLDGRGLTLRGAEFRHPDPPYVRIAKALWEPSVLLRKRRWHCETCAKLCLGRIWLLRSLRRRQRISFRDVLRVKGCERRRRERKRVERLEIHGSRRAEATLGKTRPK